MAMSKLIVIVQVVTTCSIIGSYQCFKGMYYLHLWCCILLQHWQSLTRLHDITTLKTTVKIR